VGYLITRQRREQMKMIEKLRKEKDLKKIKFKGKKDLPLAVKIGLMKMGFDIEDN
jgi:hypothetical protein